MAHAGETAGFAFDSPAAAAAAIVRELSPVSTEIVPLDQACGRTLAEAIVADRPSPALDVSAMDGYAVRLADLSLGELPVAGDISIGRECPGMPSKAALRIVTGAPVPSEADAVIKREDVDELDGRIRIRAPHEVKRGQSIRRRGENIAAGAAAITPGALITPATVGAMASFGAVSPRVYRKVRAAIIVTGDEVLGADQTPMPWQLRDSNGPALAAMLCGAPWLSVTSRTHARDDRDELRDAVARALEHADALFLTGGVSMGHKDFVPGVLDELGVRTLFHKLPQRPGKPVLLAVSSRGQAVFALLGNPVSVMVTARRLAVQGLRRLAGLPAPELRALVRLDAACENRASLWWHRPVRVIAPGVVSAIEGKGSGDVVHAAKSDGFVEIPPLSAGASGAEQHPFYSWNLS